MYCDTQHLEKLKPGKIKVNFLEHKTVLFFFHKY